MKIFISTAITLLTITLATISFAASDVTVEWEMTDTTNVTGYKMYYSSDSNMANKIWHQECQAPVEEPALYFTMLCPNVPLDPAQTTYFTVVAVTATDEVASDINTITVSQPPVPIAKIPDFTVITGGNIPFFVNFQPSDAPVPTGFKVDSGQGYDSTVGYGWIQLPNSLGARDRNNTASPDQAYDTMIHVKPEAVWKLAVANGTYKVTICMGDPSYPGGTPDVQAEGSTIISGQALSTYNQWIEESANIQVTDGGLTITFAGSTDPARICWIKVELL